MLTSSKMIAVASVALLTVGLSGCGSQETPSAPGTSAAAGSGSKPVCTADDVTVTGAPASAPTITIPDSCTPPTTLIVKDLADGTGPGVAAGDSVTVNYSLVTWSDKKALDSSWSRNEPYQVENVGQAAVIEGWNQGLIGIKKGTRRLLVVPPELGYGAGGNGVAPNETLVFVIDAVSIP